MNRFNRTAQVSVAVLLLTACNADKEKLTQLPASETAAAVTPTSRATCFMVTLDPGRAVSTGWRLVGRSGLLMRSKIPHGT